MTYSIPAYSQHLDIKDKKWRRRSCGVVAFKMVLDFWEKQTSPTFPELLKNGQKMKAYIRGVGWSHAGIAKLAKKYGFAGKNFDWFLKKSEWAFKKTRIFLKTGPVIVSIHKDLNPKKSGHLVVVTRITASRVYYLDPDAYARDNIRRVASKKRFLAGWKRRMIIVRPRGLHRK
ncbi:MAG: cysteine peptidase family C39 domain-containing protein [Patescibacteria group bacterium]